MSKRCRDFLQKQDLVHNFYSGSDIVENLRLVKLRFKSNSEIIACEVESNKTETSTQHCRNNVIVRSTA